tara:strand:+ start:264 stop:434 length:171 start_codon:yes stop_codon:yes gene_type:complete
MITLIKPLLISFIQTNAVKTLIIDLLAVCAARTDNKLDDQAVALVREKLLNDEKSN